MCFRRCACLCVLLSLLGMLLSPGTAAAASASCVPPPVAHRGDSSLAPENTRAAFRRALRGGVRALEMDVRFTADGIPVVMHDARVDRTTNGVGAVADMTLVTLKKMDAGSWFAARFARVRVPTLYEVLKDGVRYRARYFVELKVRPTAPQLAAVLARFDRLGIRARVVLTSWDPATLADVRAAAPDLRTAIIDDPGYREPSSVLEHGTVYLPPRRSVTAENSLSWRQSGIEVYSWTVDSRRGWLRMADEVVAGTITNRPVRYLAWARAFCG